MSRTLITIMLTFMLVFGAGQALQPQTASAHPAFSGTWSTYQWTKINWTWCGDDGWMYQSRSQMEKWRYWNYNHGFWIDHHDHLISTWTVRVYSCTSQA